MKTITQNAVLQRIRRRLSRDSERLVIPRSSHAWQQLGLHIVDANSFVIASHCSVQALADELYLLAPDEQLKST